jgi:hypothetical protein
MLIPRTALWTVRARTLVAPEFGRGSPPSNGGGFLSFSICSGESGGFIFENAWRAAR